MSKIKYQNINFSEAKRKIIDQAEAICNEYAALGYDITLRQCYYQFVARDLFPEDWADPETGSTNNTKSYKKLQVIVNDARLAGLIDWEHIVDRTRETQMISTWESPESVLSAVSDQFKTDKWRDQAYRLECWIEKEALVGVVEPVCKELEIPFLACRGYTSQSEVWGAAQRLLHWRGDGQKPVIIHLGDHDPSGIDMSRDIRDRMEIFRVYDLIFERIALNMDQVEQYGPPPNPAKTTDARFNGYAEEFGDESWELDALEPTVIADLIRKAVAKYRDERKWKKSHGEQEMMRHHLVKVKDRWSEVVEFLNE